MIRLKFIRIFINLFMAALLLFLLSYPLTRGLFRHGLCGLALFLSFLCHHLLNKYWYKSLFRGQWNWLRIIIYGTDIILLIITILAFISSLLLFGEVFSFAPFPMTWWARSLHNCVSAWLFIFVAIHLGLHWHKPGQIGLKVFGKLFLPLAILAIIGGLFSLQESGLLQNLFLLNDRREIPQSEVQFLGQYLLIALTFYLCPTLILNHKRKT